jgi:hypothetical protein
MNPGVSQVAHNVLAIRAALEDAGLEASDLDGVLTKAPTSTFPMLWGPRICEALRVTPKVTGTLDQAGASNIGLIQYAISNDGCSDSGGCPSVNTHIGLNMFRRFISCVGTIIRQSGKIDHNFFSSPISFYFSF